MKQAVFALALCAVLAVAAGADDPSVSLEGVVDLTPENIDSIVNGAKHVLVEFYAPWCGHCKRMTADYGKVGQTVKSNPGMSSRVVIAKVNADDHKELSQRFGVSGFPTIKFFARGQPVTEPEDYRGARTADAFLEFINSKLEADKGFGRVEEMDAFAGKFMAPGADLKAVLAEAEAAAGKVDEELKGNADLYVKAMKKAIEKGTGYFATEGARLDRMISSGSVSAAKLGELSKKLSVLTSFTEGAADEE